MSEGARASGPLRVHVVPTPSPTAGPPINLVDTLLRAADGRPPEKARFAELHAWSREHVRLVNDVANAQLALYPSERFAENQNHARAAAEAAERSGKTLLFFNAGDTWTAFPLDCGMLYRTSLQRDLARLNERAMPAFTDDAWAEASDFVFVSTGTRLDPAWIGPLARPAVPSVGFCGFVGTPMSRLFCLATGQTQKWRGLHLRNRAVRALRRSEGVDAQIITRNQFGGRAALASADLAAARHEERVDFLNNMLGTAYTLCLRGKGNFSFRFFEVLSAGRIPLFVDTKCVLPFEDELKWRELLAWCDESELQTIADRLRQFHASLDEADFLQRQATLRALWQSHLSALGFFQQLVKRHAVHT